MKPGKTSKKGVFLTFIAISIVVALVLIFSPAGIDPENDIMPVKARASEINDYVVDLENRYLVDSLESSGTKAVIALTGYMEAQNSFIGDFEGDFAEVVMNGTIGGVPIDSYIEPDVMEGNTYPDWTGRITEAADDAFNVQTSISINDIRVSQSTPWLLTASADLYINVSSETASWSKSITVNSEIDIQRFEDPYYIINTQGAYRPRINSTHVKAGQWGINDVREHITHTSYHHYTNSKAPSFIMRFTNTSLASSCCGIESIVNPNTVPTAGMESYADYLYFNHSYSDRCDELYNVTGLWDEFSGLQLDFEHLVTYNLTEEGVIQAC